MFKEYETFRLSKRLSDNSVPVGTRGVVLMILDKNKPKYEVEFPDEAGGNLGITMTYTIDQDFMNPDS